MVRCCQHTEAPPPINWAIYNGDTVTGVTVIHMTPKLDGGPCLGNEELTIGAEESTEQIEPRLAALGPELITKSIKILEDWDGESPIGEMQDQTLATKAPRLKKSDGQVDWNRSATEICNQIRAFKPWPATFTFLHRESGEPLRVIINDASAEQLAPDAEELPVGTVSLVTKRHSVSVRRNRHCLFARFNLQENAPSMWKSFSRGYSPEVGQLFGSSN